MSCWRHKWVRFRSMPYHMIESYQVYDCRMCTQCTKFQWSTRPGFYEFLNWHTEDDPTRFVLGRVGEEEIVLAEASTRDKRKTLLEELRRHVKC